MARTKTRTQFVCQQCGAAQPKWLGRCPDCGEWNTLVETIIETRKESAARPAGAARNEPQPLPAITAAGAGRIILPIQELNRVLGGGIVPGSAVLIGGDPGIGKSTLLLQLSALLAEAGREVLYISGEESAQQILSLIHI